MSPRERRADVSTRTRAGDSGPWARVRAWWSKWGELIKGVSGIIACVGCLILGAFMFLANQEQTRDQRAVRVLAQEQLRITRAEAVHAKENVARAKETALLARDQCRRSKALGPSLADDYARRKVLTGANLELYRSLIPKTCPK